MPIDSELINKCKCGAKSEADHGITPEGEHAVVTTVVEDMGVVVGRRLHAQPVHLTGKSITELGEQLRVHEILAQRVENTPLQFLATHVGPVLAGALVACCRAAQQGAGDHRIVPDTDASYKYWCMAALRKGRGSHERYGKAVLSEVRTYYRFCVRSHDGWLHVMSAIASSQS